MKTREVAWRVFASEYNASTLEIKGEGEKAPSYVVTPLGAMVNRVFIVGLLTDLQNLGTEGEPYWRALLSDGMNKYYLFAGKYNPEATLMLSKLQPPAYVAVVGKTRTYSPEEGKIFVSIRPEKIIQVDDDIKDNWVLEAARSTLKRIDCMEEAMQMESPTADELVKLGYSPALAEGVVRALPHYKDVELNRYRGMVLEALEQLLPERSGQLPIPADMPSAGPEEIEDEGDDGDKEELVLKLIDRLDTNKKGAPLADLIREAAKSGIGEAELEEINNSLLDKGLIYEPTIGKMKRI
ncbi:MAG: glycerol dehydrogenase [Methanomassiliicoccus sp.]|nr:glycerol dehydrogenase [Methanomassiliicoccus sp.]